MQQLSQLYSTFLSAVAALDKIMEVLEEDPQVTDEAAAPSSRSVRGHVRFDGVHFTYGTGPGGAARDRPRRPGGDDGRARRPHRRRQVDDREADRALLRPDRGRDHGRRHRPPRACTQESLRRRLGIVPQEGFLFAGTVAENIAFGRPEASREEIVAAARAVGADEFIEQLEDGYDTAARRARLRLSLGQRQLVAFARALLADPRDPDPRRGDELGRHRAPSGASSTRSGGSSTAAPRSSSRTASRPIRGANLIVVLEHGIVVEQGTHDELLARGGRYAELYGSWAAEADVA